MRLIPYYFTFLFANLETNSKNVVKEVKMYQRVFLTYISITFYAANSFVLAYPFMYFIWEYKSKDRFHFFSCTVTEIPCIFLKSWEILLYLFIKFPTNTVPKIL